MASKSYTAHIAPVTPAQAERGIDRMKVFPALEDGQVFCGYHGVQLGVFHDTLAACESLVSWYTRRHGGVEPDPDEDPFRCIHDELVEPAVRGARHQPTG